MKDIMPRKSKNKKLTISKYYLPTSNEALSNFIENKKIEMMEQTVNSIEYALENNLPVVELFQFEKSDFSVMMSDKDFLLNLDHIYDHYIENEMYELCDRVTRIKKKLSSVINLNET